MNNDIIEKIPVKESDKILYKVIYENDPDFRSRVDKMERHWLDNANKILNEIIDAIREKINDPETTMSDLVKALDTISTKWNLAMGKPTSIDLDAKITYTKNMKDEEIDKRLEELEKHFISSTSVSLLSNDLEKNDTVINIKKLNTKKVKKEEKNEEEK